MSKAGVKIEVRGIVQGVGFRPFIHRMVERYHLRGWVRNTSFGAELHLEGEEEDLLFFLRDLPEKKPMLAQIEGVTSAFCEASEGFTDFRILPSEGAQERDTLISPDVCTCEDCQRELFDPSDRRYRYPFINCTNCGPRFTIIRDIPYDRANTTMAAFPMCVPCREEYGDIRDRRYHAQPDCCPDCGPALRFAAGERDGSRDANTADRFGEQGISPMDRRAPEDGPDAAVRLAQDALRAGKIVAVKGLGGYHLACRADDPELALTLRRRKHRDEKPFALMCADAEEARKYCRISEEEEKLLTSPARPIVLLKKKDPASFGHISENARIGIMLPYTPLHFLLLHDDLKTLVMTSANLSDRPILRTEEEVFRELAGIADAFLVHNREIHVRCDDSVMWGYGGGYFARRSRGYVPLPLEISREHASKPAEMLRQILACGAEQKATFSLSKGSHVFPCQHIGDLKNIESLENYENQIRHFERMFSIRPEAVVCDLHPDYLSTEYAVRRAAEDGIPLLKVQHHHAHMASCMADNGITEPVIGIVWDGTGLGEDGTVWGGEFLTGDYRGFRRAGHIRGIALPGGDRAMEEILRTAVSLLWDAGVPAEEIHEAAGRSWKREGEIPETAGRSWGIPEAAGETGGSPAECGSSAEAAGNTAHTDSLRRQIPTWLLMLEKNINCPVSTGMGRLFDGVSALLGIRDTVSYEGQGAILLEAMAAEDCDDRYTVKIGAEDGAYVFDTRPMIRELWEERRDGQEGRDPRIAAKFMNTLIDMAVEICRRISGDTGLRTVVLSGGTFQNMYLLERLVPALREAGLSPLTHHRVSANDEGISLGQLMIAGARLEEEASADS